MPGVPAARKQGAHAGLPGPHTTCKWVQDVLHRVEDGQARGHATCGWGTELGAVLATSHHPFPKALERAGVSNRNTQG